MVHGKDISHRLLVCLVSSLSIGLFVAHRAQAAGGDNTYCSASETWVGPATDGFANLPQTCVYTAMSATPSPGKVWPIAPGSSSSQIQSILNGASCGDVIQFQAGQIYQLKNSLTLSKSCPASNWITLETSAMSSLPPEGTRVSPCYANVQSLNDRPSFNCPSGGPAAVMPTLLTMSVNTSVILASTSTSHYRLIGLELSQVAGVQIGAKLVNFKTFPY